MAADGGIYGVAARAGDHENQEDHKIDKGKLTRHKGGAVVDHQEGDKHIQDDGD